MTGKLNTFVSGAWSKYEDVAVRVVEIVSNGRAAVITMPGSAKRRGPVPLKWVTLDETEEAEKIAAPARCPHCGQEMPR